MKHEIQFCFIFAVPWPQRNADIELVTLILYLNQDFSFWGFLFPCEDETKLSGEGLHGRGFDPPHTPEILGVP
jgi:hypothetical protein